MKFKIHNNQAIFYFLIFIFYISFSFCLKAHSNQSESEFWSPPSTARETFEAPFFQTISTCDIQAIQKSSQNQKDVTDESGHTPYHVAIYFCDANVVQLIHSLYPSLVNKANLSGVTPLHKAIDVSHFEIIHFLILNGANVNKPDNFGNTPLHDAVFWGDKQIVQLLLNSGARASINTKNNWGDSPVVTARSKEIVQFLIENGAKLDTQNNSAPIITAQ